MGPTPPTRDDRPDSIVAVLPDGWLVTVDTETGQVLEPHEEGDDGSWAPRLVDIHTFEVTDPGFAYGPGIPVGPTRSRAPSSPQRGDATTKRARISRISPRRLQGSGALAADDRSMFDDTPTSGRATRAVPVAGMQVDVLAVERRAAHRRLLHPTSFSVGAGELVAIAGGSGAGKSTLLETLAGLARPSSGIVLHDGRPADGSSTDVGFVPQDDIIHRELPLGRTLRYAAGLRLPAGLTPLDHELAVEAVLDSLDLCDRADVAVGRLSGGQRKRASIAAELLTHPRLLLLDEPTSGLDPATAAEVMALLRRLASSGVTVILTTHSVTDIDACDRVIFLAPGGHLAFVGEPEAAITHLGADNMTDVYQRLAVYDPASVTEPPEPISPPPELPRIDPPRQPVGAFRQWRLLVRRTTEVTLRNRLTLAILLGSPLMVTLMMATLFRSGTFDAGAASSLGPTQAVFWIAFAGFFFGLTYGLLQIVGETPIVRRERLAGLHLGAYLVAKVTVLTPVLTVVLAALLGILRLLDRLPAVGWRTYGVLLGILVVESIAALALGLVASAAVADPAQATLALPMLCFPQVLFAGAVVPVAEMALPGRLISAGMANRWAFESIGRSLGLGDELAAGDPMTAAFTGSGSTGVAILAVLASVCLVAGLAALRIRTRPDTRG
jgi:ABC transport system ATP-binding/permease protein